MEKRGDFYRREKTKNSLKPLCLIIMCFLMVNLVGISIVSAFEIDNWKYEREVTFDGKFIQGNKLLEKYKPIEIKNAFGFGEKLWEGYFTQHDETCGEHCESTQMIKLNKKGSLVDEVIFKTLQEDESWIEQPIKSYKIQINVGQQPYEVDDYEYQCSQMLDKNGTTYEHCEKVKTGSHTEYNKDWEDYNLGSEMESGVYEIKLTGEKEKTKTVDWIYKTQGETLDAWATWGGGGAFTIYDLFDKGSESPLNQSIWVNTTQSGASSTIEKAAGYLELFGNSDFAQVNSTAFMNVSEFEDRLINVSFGNRITGSGSTRINVFGTDILNKVISGTESYWWDLIMNGSNVEVYNHSVWVMQITPTNNVFLFEKSGAGSGQLDNIFNLTYYEIQGSVTLNSPENNYVSPTNNISLDATGAIIGGATIVNATSYLYNFDGSINQTNITTGLSGSTNTTIHTFILVDGVIYNWTRQNCDSDGDCGSAPENRTISADTSNPIISLESPNGTLNYGLIGGNETLNVNITDPNLDSCWYDYNGTNISLGCQSGIKNSTNFILESNNLNMTIYANDSLGRLSTSFTNWTYYVLAEEINYSATTTTTSSEDFTITGTKDLTISSISSILEYDGTNYTSTASIDGDNFLISNNIEIPAGSSSRIFKWYITSTGTAGTINTETVNYTQTVTNLSISNCTSPSLDGLTLNFTTYDARTRDLLNASFEGTFEFYAEGGTGDVVEEYNFFSINESQSNWMFCLNSSGLNVTLDGFYSYYSDGYDRREYIIDDGIIGNFTQNIPLYLALTADTDIVTITVIDQNYVALEGALVAIQNWIVGTNTYNTIGMFTTSSEGTGIMNLELYNIWYRAVVNYQGSIVRVTDVQKLSDTTWNIIVELGVDNAYDLFDTISHGLTFDNVTNITSFTWLDNSGYTQEGCLEVRRSTSLGYDVQYYDCTTSVSGTINYQLNGSGEYNILGTIELLPLYNVSRIVDTLSERLGTPELAATISRFGKVLSLLFIGTSSAIGMAAGNPYYGLVLLIVSIIGSMKMGWLNITESILWGFISIGIIIIFRISRKGT